ncbi:MAG TPA: hypothetical protein EYQ50_27450 [Verrucomicrobiales bacterium]|nr:hypothetical protein [Verrucomicrobiales bacterium]
MDVTLATMRLIDGYEKSRDGASSLGQRRVTLTVLSALFHDSGYIRHRQDKVHKNGAEYTKTHVTRSTQYLKQYLLGTRLEENIPFVTRLIHYTGYEIPLDKIEFDDPDDNRVGWMLGTADLIAQMSDRMYLEKCRDYLFLEFELGGVLTRTNPDGEQEVVYSSSDELLAATPDFIRNTVENRLKKSFHKVYSYAAAHFNGPNLYMEALEKNCNFLENLVAKDQLHLLRRNSPRGTV